MCGLIGNFDFSTSKYFSVDSDAFFSMLLLNSLRGAHSTGAFAVRIDGRMEFIKVVGDPYKLNKWKDWDDFLSRIPIKYTALVGHGRLATKGAITVKNAHPFRRGKITLVHNGTISNFEDLKKVYGKNSSFEVDSDLCANLFHDFPAEEVLEKLDGAFAFIFYNEEAKTLNVVRNYERPLFMFNREDKNQYIFSSDESIFGWLKDKYKMTGSSSPVPTGKLLTFSLGKEEYTITDVKLYTKVYPAYHGTGYAGYLNYEDADFSDNIPFEKNKNTYTHIPDTYQNGKQTPIKAMSKIAKEFKSILDKAKSSSEIGIINSETYQYNNTKVSVGDYVKWVPISYYEQKPAIHSNQVQTLLTGKLVDTEIAIEVSGHTTVSINEIIADGLLVGKIKSITVFPPDNKLHCRIYVEEIKTFKDTIEDIKEADKYIEERNKKKVKKTKIDSILLYDKSELSRKDFNLLAMLGCPTCKSPILPQQADFILHISNRLYCPECTLYARYPRN